jgi:FkbM family methyltransferase
VPTRAVMAERLPPPPSWFRAGRAVARRLPRGRFRAFALLANRVPAPFVDRLGDDAGGMLYRCDLRHSIARETCLTGRYAPLETALMRACLEPGETFVDVGANFGYFTLLGAAATGPGGRVIALEPDPRMVAELRSNIALNRLESVNVIGAAASDRSGAITLAGFTEAGGNWGVSTIARPAEGAEPAFTVRAAPLDTLLDEAEVGEVGLVKIDVEGAEALVLAGMGHGLSAGRYRRLLVEFHPWHFDDFAAAFVVVNAELNAAGYTGWILDDGRAATRAAHYGATVSPLLHRLGQAAPAGAWPHVFWTLPGAEPDLDGAPGRT